MSKVIDFQKAVPERKFNGKRIEIARVFRGIHHYYLYLEGLQV